MLEPVDCPYCGECFETDVEIYAGSQDYIEDCPVCCRPIEFPLHIGEADRIASLSTRRDAE